MAADTEFCSGLSLKSSTAPVVACCRPEAGLGILHGAKPMRPRARLALSTSVVVVLRAPRQASFGTRCQALSRPSSVRRRCDAASSICRLSSETFGYGKRSNQWQQCASFCTARRPSDARVRTAVFAPRQNGHPAEVRATWVAGRMPCSLTADAVARAPANQRLAFVIVLTSRTAPTMDANIGCSM